MRQKNVLYKPGVTDYRCCQPKCTRRCRGNFQTPPDHRAVMTVTTDGYETNILLMASDLDLCVSFVHLQMVEAFLPQQILLVVASHWQALRSFRRLLVRQSIFLVIHCSISAWHNRLQGRSLWISFITMRHWSLARLTSKEDAVTDSDMIDPVMEKLRRLQVADNCSCLQGSVCFLGL